jgi:O-acetyl-ADP-ribose deacetylase (regulator of RNase III)
LITKSNYFDKLIGIYNMNVQPAVLQAPWFTIPPPPPPIHQKPVLHSTNPCHLWRDVTADQTSTATYADIVKVTSVDARNFDCWRTVKGNGRMKNITINKDSPIPIYNRFESLSNHMTNEPSTSHHMDHRNTIRDNNKNDYHRFKLNYIEGNLLNHSQHSIVHCVGGDFLMKRGFAVEIRERFGNVTYLWSLDKKPGEVVVLPLNDKYIFYLVTKNISYDKPNIEDLQKSLIELRNICLSLGVNHISMPKIASGRDHIPWRKVQWIIRTVFADTEIVIDVYVLKNSINKKRPKNYIDTPSKWYESVRSTQKQVSSSFTPKTNKTQNEDEGCSAETRSCTLDAEVQVITSGAPVWFPPATPPGDVSQPCGAPLGKQGMGKSRSLSPNLSSTSASVSSFFASTTSRKPPGNELEVQLVKNNGITKSG